MSEGSTMGAIFGGWIADAYSFRSLFLAGTASAMICLIIVLLKVPEPPKVAVEMDAIKHD